MAIRIGSFEFTRPGLIPALATLLVFPALLSLGFWQLDRAEQKRTILAEHEAGQLAPPIDLNQDQPALAQARYRQAKAYGDYDGERQFLIDNQMLNGRPGYLILTPLQLAGEGIAVLVAREWVPAGSDRRQLPDVAMQSWQGRALQGVLDLGPSVGMRLGPPAAPDDDGWPRRVLYIDFDYLGEQLPYPVLPYLLRLDNHVPFAEGQMGPETHLGYAVQWFGLAAALVVIFLVVNLRRLSGDERERE